eukprot:3234681-Amphidinium_carterae.1
MAIVETTPPKLLHRMPVQRYLFKLRQDHGLWARPDSGLGSCCSGTDPLVSRTRFQMTYGNSIAARSLSVWPAPFLSEGTSTKKHSQPLKCPTQDCLRQCTTCQEGKVHATDCDESKVLARSDQVDTKEVPSAEALGQ